MTELVLSVLLRNDTDFGTCISLHPCMCNNSTLWSHLQYKVWVKPGAEQSFLYGNHVLKSGLGRITENTMQYQGVVVYSMADVPLVSLL